MPIIAIEGPDKCGKSTLFDRIQTSGLINAKFIRFPSFGKSRMHIASELALRDLELWEAFYDPKQLYICDRHVITSDAVYSQLYGRPKLRKSVLLAELKVVYIAVPAAELATRHTICREDVQDWRTYKVVLAAYPQVIRSFPHRVIQSNTTVADVAAIIEELVYESR